MNSYNPPYQITDTILTLVAEIAEKTGGINSYSAFVSKPHLRRNNRIRSIHSSLAIEANSLSMDAVKDVIQGKAVLGSQKEIQEVKNAYWAYDEIGKFDPYSLESLLRLHGIMTYSTVKESGIFRSGNEGVFNGNRCIFMAPPPYMVAELMKNLFAWMRQASETVHPLVLSCVFHYEFVFIHPFEDGNGRMARLWQTALLANWNPVFQYLPVESRIQEFQDDYYRVIAQCHTAGNSTAFIEFMLDKINRTMDWALNQIATDHGNLSIYEQRMLDVMEYDMAYTANTIMQALGLKSKETFRKHYLNPLLQRGLVAMGIPDKPTSRNHTYIRK